MRAKSNRVREGTGRRFQGRRKGKDVIYIKAERNFLFGSQTPDEV